MKTSRNPYNIKDHLGNVRVTFADVKIPANGQLLDFYTEMPKAPKPPKIPSKYYNK